MKPLIDLQSQRAREARFSQRLGKTGYQLLLFSSLVCFIAAVGLTIVDQTRWGILLLSPAALFYMPAVWWKKYLKDLPSHGHTVTDRLSVDILARLKPTTTLQPSNVWQLLSIHWQARFIANHLLLSGEVIEPLLSSNEADMAQALQVATQIANSLNSPTIELGFVAAGILLSSPAIQQVLVQQKSQPLDITNVADWLGRTLIEDRRAKQSFGGVGRDWAFGFTPLLNRFGQNVSLTITKYGSHFGGLTDSAGVLALQAALTNSGGAAIALVGPDGIGKTTSVYALAQRMIEGGTTNKLAYHQVIILNATDIASRAQGPRDLEQIMISLANEAAHAGHVILFFDNAQQFFGEGHGAFDASQILLSIVEARSVPMILALTTSDWQRLRARNPSMGGLLTPVILQEPDEANTMQVLEDAALNIETRQKVLVPYEALREAYRLSGRYDQDEAYPGRAIKLLEQAVNHAQHSAVTASSVQQAIEQTHGVKVSGASPAEANDLLHLEDRIHERMINQTHAVSVVANALRRARAGVGNPRRPIGSFLFLGPTGVGKTELAKAIAATYFGSEKNMIRLDMSEYQQPDDVQRLLATGQQEASSLLLSVRQQPFTVVLLDEIEKAHPNILNLLLQLLDEGQLTDVSGRPTSFKDCVIITTSNAGAAAIREQIAQGRTLESFTSEFTDQLINSGQFKPELLNRFDELVLFRPLNPSELAQVVQLMLGEVNQTLANQNISVTLTDAAIQLIVQQGNDPRLGARPMRRTLQRAVEDVIAQRILSGQVQSGDHLTLDASDLSLGNPVVPNEPSPPTNS